MRPVRLCAFLLCLCSACLLAQQPALERAWNLAAEGKRAEAIQILQQLIGAEPTDADARLLLGSLLMEKGDQPGSIAQLKAAVALRPRSEEAQNALGEAYNKFGATSDAQTAFEKAVALKPNDGIAEMNLGEVLLKQGKLQEAGKALDRAIPLLGKTDDAADADYFRAQIFSAQGQAERAAKLLQQAVAIRNNFAEAWSDLGQARQALSDDAGALAAYEHAATANPQDAVAQYRLGAEYLRQDQTQAGLQHIQKAYELNPKDQSTLNALQTALRRTGDVEGANRIKQQLADLLRERDQESQNKLTAVRLNNEGAALEKSGDLRAALAKYRQAAQLYPGHVGIEINFGVALLRLGQWTEGLNTLHDALLRDPQNEQLRAALKDALKQAPPQLVPNWNQEDTALQSH